MTYSSFIKGLKNTWRHHRLTIVLLVLLSVIAASSRYLLRADLGGGTAGSSSSSSSEFDQLRSCSSKGTIFEDMTSLRKVMDTFQQRTSDVVKERQTLLSSPSKWLCIPDDNGSSEPPMPKLQALANDMPGWHYQYVSPLDPGSAAVKALKPVTFGSFASVLGEFEREYECKLTEFQDRAFIMVLNNYDLDNKGAQFCCDDQKSCGLVEPANTANCTSPVTDDPQCGGACAIKFNQADLAIRPQEYFDLQMTERMRARTAMQRTIDALRSFDTNYVFALQLTCFERSSLDLKNELSLMADATSCIPKIWDALTSLHDRSPKQK